MLENLSLYYWIIIGMFTVGCCVSIFSIQTDKWLPVKVIVSDLKTLSYKEAIWMIFAFGAICWISWDGKVIDYICAATGVVGAILIAKGAVSGYYYGYVSTLLYTIISYQYGLFGETIVYAVLFLPLQIFGAYLWFANSDSEVYNIQITIDNNELNSFEYVNVHKNKLSIKNRIYLIVGTLVAIGLYALFIKYIEGSQPGLDSATAVLSIVATLLMVFRFAEQWLIWMMVNIVAVVMWIIALYSHTGESPAYSILAMWVIYLMNSTYGWFNWKKLATVK